MKIIRIVLLLLCIAIIGEGCRPPRCRIPTCYVRMKHRHDGGKVQTTETNVTDRGAASASMGQEYRGVPFWQRNKNPKIGEGYKPGYKYNYRKGKWKKPKKKKQRQPEEVQPEEGQELIGDTVAEEEKPAEKRGFLKRKKNKNQEEPTEEAPVEEPVKEPARKPARKAEPPAEKDGF